MSTVSSSSSSASTSTALNAALTPTGTGSSTFQISGLASGLDDSSIIAQLMQIQSIPQTRIIQQTTLETTRQTDLKAIQTQLNAFSTAVSQLVDPSTWSTSQQVTSSDPNVTATGTGVPPGGFQVAVSQLARAAQMTQTSSMTTANGDDTLAIQVGSGTAFNVNVKSGDSLQTIAASINSAAGTQMFASVVNSKLVLSSQITGGANTISVASTGGGTAAADLGLSQTVTPRDALYTVDGGSTLTSASNTVTNLATGLSVTFNGTTSNASITVAQAGPNTAGVQKAIQNFVDVYNTTITAISDKLNEQKVANPATDDDRAKGDLADDSSLRSILTQLREAVGSAFTGTPQAMSALSQAGLSTGAAVGTGTLNQDSIDGILTLDTTKLGTQLTSQFQNVKNLFTNVTNNFGTEGVAQRLNDVLRQYSGAKGVLTTEINGESTMIANLNQQKADWDVRLAERQTALQAKFTAMETAMSKLQSQGSWLSSTIAKL